MTVDLTPEPQLEVLSGDGQWLAVAEISVLFDATVDVTELQLAAQEAGPHQLAYAKVPNTFAPPSSSQSSYLLLNLLGKDGELYKASLMMPSTGVEGRAF